MTPPANRRILLIDDTPSIHEDFRKILSAGAGADMGSEMAAAEEALFGEATEPTGTPSFDLDSAYQGREGLEMVCSSLQEASPYALAFVHMRMPPGWDGAQTIREIWKVDPRLQIVICTAHSDYSWDALLGKLGAEDRLLVLKKPFDNIEVAQLTSALTTKWDMTRQAELKVSHLEDAVQERTQALQIANQGATGADRRSHPPRHSRRVDRAAQPGPVRRPSRPSAGGGSPRRQSSGGVDVGPRPVQGSQ